MKKIIFCVTNDLNHDQRMHRICSTLQDTGYAIELVGRKLASSKELTKQNFAQYRLKCIFDKGKLFYLEFNIRLFFYLLNKKSEAYVANDIDTVLAVYFASVLKGKKRVFDAHELFSEVPELDGRPIATAIWRHVEKCFIPKFKIKYTVSQSIIDFFKEVYEQSFELVRNVPILNKEAIAYNHEQRPKIILYQGALNDGRGLEQMIEAMKGIHSYVLHIAGTGDLDEKLKAKVKELDLQKSVVFLGMLSPNVLREETLKASIGINLLENKGLSYYYSLANKYFDYMHAGIPCISMNFPEYQNLNQQYETAILIDELSSEAIVEALFKLQDAEYYKKIHDNCLVAREIYNWENESKKLIEIYSRLFY